MIDIRKVYFKNQLQFRSDIPQNDKGVAVLAVERPVTVLESAEVKARHAQIQAECGLDKNLKPLKKPRTQFKEGMAGDPVYYAEQLAYYGKEDLSWEDF